MYFSSESKTAEYSFGFAAAGLISRGTKPNKFQNKKSN